MADEGKWDAAKRRYEAAESVTDRILLWLASWKCTLAILLILAGALLWATVKILR